MSEPHTETAQSTGSVNGAASSELEARLRHLFGEQDRLRALLDQTRAELDRINAELHRFQDDYCTDATREEEYNCALEKILGFDPRIDLNEIEEILAGKRHCDMKGFIEEMEREIEATPSPGG
jgi:hypothetical protein